MKWTCDECGQAFQIPEQDDRWQMACPRCGTACQPAHGGPAAEDAAANGPAAEDLESTEPAGGWLSMSVSSLVSLFVHMALLLLCAFVVYDPGVGLDDEQVQIGLLPHTPLARPEPEELDPSAVSTPAEEQWDPQWTPPKPVETASAGAPFDESLLAIGPTGFGAEFADAGQPGATAGIADVTTFMDISATGRRFCIIADTSGSMAGPKLEYVKEEILETVGSMRATAQFQVVFFSSREIPYPRSGWLHPRKEYADLEAWLKERSGSGGTQPTPAFRVAFGLDPAPDAIFFMTDGLFPASVVDDVAALQRTTGKQVVIHTISFMDRTAEFLMQEIARNSGGKYRHVAGF